MDNDTQPFELTGGMKLFLAIVDVLLVIFFTLRAISTDSLFFASIFTVFSFIFTISAFSCWYGLIEETLQRKKEKLE